MAIDQSAAHGRKKPVDSSQVCPVCKSSTYLNPHMIFKVNPECYHKMCTTCIERIFQHGPNTCPIAGCGKYLRPQNFKIPRFEDLAIERECDIRAHVGSILNHQESDFETPRQFNDYEEWKEEQIMSLVANENVEAIEKQLQAYAKEHAETIAMNREAEMEHRVLVAQNERERKERSELARTEAMRERQEELAEREAGRREVVDKILNANSDVLKVAKEAEKAVKQRAAARAGAAEAAGAAKTNIIKSSSSQKPLPPSSSAAAKASATNPLSKATPEPGSSAFKPAGLKARPRKPAPGSTPPQQEEEPYDPFGGHALGYKYYTFNENGYNHPWSNEADKDPRQYVAGGRALEYQRRAQFEAHSGLGVFVQDEKAEVEAGMMVE